MRIFALDDCEIIADGYRFRFGAVPFTRRSKLMEALKNERPDLLILDLNIGKPCVNGWTIADEARELYPGIPIIIATAYTDDTQKTLAKIKGLDFWSKGGVEDFKTLRELVCKYGKPTRPSR